MEINLPEIIGEPQEFTVVDPKMPGLNDMINAAKKTLIDKRVSASNKFKKARTVRIPIFTMYEILKNKWVDSVSSTIIKSGIVPVDKCFLRLTWYEPRRNRDPDNIAAFIKFILDAMQKTNIIKNDGWNEVKGWYNEFIINKTRSVKVGVYQTK